MRLSDVEIILALQNSHIYHQIKKKKNCPEKLCNKNSINMLAQGM